MMSVPVAASHADSGSKGDSSGSSTSQSSSAKKGKPASDGSGTVSVTAPVTRADGTKVVTARPVSPAERKADLAASDSPEEMAKERETEAYKTVQEYWTPERIANAKPAPVGSSGASSQKSLKKSVEKAKKALQKEEKLANDKQIAHANGKVLYYDDKKGKDYVCSASAVDSPTKRIVVTAAHCVHGGKGGTWYSNWMFVPAYDKKNRPYGTFPAYHMHAMDEWQREADPDHGKGFESDVAFVTTKNNERGQRLVDTVGGHRLVLSDRTDFDTTIIGYPQNVNGGETMEVCKKPRGASLTTGSPSSRCGDAVSGAAPRAAPGSKTTIRRRGWAMSVQSPRTSRVTRTTCPISGRRSSTIGPPTCSRKPTTTDDGRRGVRRPAAAEHKF